MVSARQTHRKPLWPTAPPSSPRRQPQFVARIGSAPPSPLSPPRPLRAYEGHGALLDLLYPLPTSPSPPLAMFGPSSAPRINPIPSPSTKRFSSAYLHVCLFGWPAAAAEPVSFADNGHLKAGPAAAVSDMPAKPTW